MLSAGNIVNALLFQVNWFACVMGGSRGMYWLPLTTLSVMLLLAARRPARREDLSLMTIAALLGLGLDTLWIRLGILDFGGAQIAPGWIVMMWMGAALTINHSLHWLRSKPLLGGLLAAASAPLCYLAGERLGAVTLAPAGLALIAIAWLLVFACCFSWSGKLAGAPREV